MIYLLMLLLAVIVYLLCVFQRMMVKADKQEWIIATQKNHISVLQAQVDKHTNPKCSDPTCRRYISRNNRLVINGRHYCRECYNKRQHSQEEAK